MDYDQSKVDEMTLALMFLTSFSEQEITRSWKGYDWGVLGRLHTAGLIYDPVGKAKSVVLTEEGRNGPTSYFRSILHALPREKEKARLAAMQLFMAGELRSLRHANSISFLFVFNFKNASPSRPDCSSTNDTRSRVICPGGVGFETSSASG